MPAELMAFYHFRDELVVTEDGLILKGARCVIPKSLRLTILQRLHSSHRGVSGTLKRARESVFWPGMSGQIKDYISKCDTCSAVKVTAQRPEPLQPHDRPVLPWAKVGIDLFSLDQRSFLITVDYWSKYWELDELKTTEATAVIRCLKRHFARHGIPDEVISDNGPQFVSEKFADFETSWMFKHTKTSPYHPRSNGLAESAVKTAKTIIKTALHAGEDVWLAVLEHRNTPTQGFTTSPVQRLMGRRTKTLVPLSAGLLRPIGHQSQDVRDRESLTSRQKFYFDQRTRPLSPLAVGQEVWVNPNTLGEKTSQKATIIGSRPGDRSYDVRLQHGGAVYRRNRSQLCPRAVRTEEAEIDEGLLEDEEEEEKGTVDISVHESLEQRTRSGRLVCMPDYLADYEVTK